MKQFITLSDVKKNGDYTFLEEREPTAADKEPTYQNGDTWLDLTTGYSYQCTDQTVATWVRIEQELDTKILLKKDEVFKNVIKYLETVFPVSRNKLYFDIDIFIEDYPDGFPEGFTRQEGFQLMTFESVFAEWEFNAVDSETFEITALSDVYGSIADSFKIGDTIYISGSRRNDGFFTITNIDATNNKISVFEEVEDGEANAFIYLCSVPDSVIQIGADMTYYDIVKRPKLSGLKSEKVGTYSYTLQDINGIGYPFDITSGLESYRSITIGGRSVFVN